MAKRLYGFREGVPLTVSGSFEDLASGESQGVRRDRLACLLECTDCVYNRAVLETYREPRDRS